MDFDTSEELTVTALGAFDEDSDGLNRDINVQLWSRDGEAGVEVLAELNFTGDDPGTLEGGQRFKALADPVTLPPTIIHVSGKFSLTTFEICFKNG